ncbi:hypothetical protein HMPREF2760_01790 [Corynebacterium sp. HMSC065D07]|nr:hypothetical protein HMPREF2760_01790 [Corynebacterium sp. HMSC065D07]
MIIKTLLAGMSSPRKSRSKVSVASAFKVTNDSRRVQRGDKNGEKHGGSVKAPHAALRPVSKPKRDVVLSTSVSGLDGGSATLIGVVPFLSVNGRPLVKVFINAVYVIVIEVERNDYRLAGTGFALLALY